MFLDHSYVNGVLKRGHYCTSCAIDEIMNDMDNYKQGTPELRYYRGVIETMLSNETIAIAEENRIRVIEQRTGANLQDVLKWLTIS